MLFPYPAQWYQSKKKNASKVPLIQKQSGIVALKKTQLRPMWKKSWDKFHLKNIEKGKLLWLSEIDLQFSRGLQRITETEKTYGKAAMIGGMFAAFYPFKKVFYGMADKPARFWRSAGEPVYKNHSFALKSRFRNWTRGNSWENVCLCQNGWT